MLNPTGISDPEKISSARLACAYIWVSTGEINPETTQSVPNTQIEKIAATITTEKILANLRYNLQSAGAFLQSGPEAASLALRQGAFGPPAN